LEVFARHNKQLLEEFTLLSQQVSDTDATNCRLRTEVDRYRGDREALEDLTIDQLEDLERDMKRALQVIEDKKV
jgi:hypothetical protein